MPIPPGTRTESPHKPAAELPAESYNHLQMQLSSGSHIPDGLLAANVLLSEKPRLGVPSWESALHQGIGEANCTAAIGLRASQSLNRVQSRYTGKERDAESNNDYFGARYYNSNMGRFMSPDPLAGKLANPQSLNRYVYGLNNPLVNTDPTGMYVCEDSTECDSQSDKDFAKSLSDAKDAARSLSGSDWADAMRGLNAYGSQGVDNGVNVRFDSSVQGGVTEVGGVANGDKSADNPNGQNINVTFYPNSVRGSFGGGLVAHEGSHVADGSDWVSSGFSPGMDPTRYGTEIKAYSAQFNVTQALPAFRTAFGVSIGGVTVIPGEPFKDARPDFQNLLKSSPLYGYSYEDTTPAFVKGSVVPQ